MEISGLDEKERTILRRNKVGFISMAFNLVPTLNAMENISLPMNLAKRPPDKKWMDYLIKTVAWVTASTTFPASCPAASNNGSPPPGFSPAGPRSSLPTSRPAT